MTVTGDTGRPVRLPRRSRQGIVLGMDGWQVGFLATAALVILIAVNRFGPVGLLYSAPIFLILGGTALATIHGISAPRMGGRHPIAPRTAQYRSGTPGDRWILKECALCTTRSISDQHGGFRESCDDTVVTDRNS